MTSRLLRLGGLSPEGVLETAEHRTMSIAQFGLDTFFIAQSGQLGQQIALLAIEFAGGLHNDLHVEVAASDAAETRHTATARDDRLAGLCAGRHRSEEHTSELQSRFDVVCRLLLEKKNELRKL